MSEKTGCYRCGGLVLRVYDNVKVRIGRELVAVTAERMRCDACGHVYYLPAQLRAARERASLATAAAHGRITGEEIKNLRQRLRLTQPQFERLLDVGEKTVARWERGTVVPNAVTNTALLLLRDVDGVAQYLARRRGVHLDATEQCEPMSPVEAQSIEVIPQAIMDRARVPSIPDDRSLDDFAVPSERRTRNVAVEAATHRGSPWIN